MYALGRTPIGTGDRIGCPGQVNSKYGTNFAKEAGAEVKLCGAGVVCYWLDNARSNGAPQSHVRLAR
jgi:hypothetical protein